MQVSHGEKTTMLDILEPYAAHCCANPDTTIHYYGLCSIRLPMCSGKKIYFVVMKNFLYSPNPSTLTTSY